MEIIFVSHDKSSAEMFRYMKDSGMPWLAAPYGSAEADALKKIKSNELQSKGIPFLAVVKDGRIVTKEGRRDVQALGAKAFEKWLTQASD